MEVKFFKQHKINQRYKSALINSINGLIDGQSAIVFGNYSKEFEENYSEYVGAKYCSFLSNGLDALSIALKVINVNPGDEIIVPNHTYIATWLAALNLGCVVVPAPVKEHNLLIDEDKIKKFITSKTKAIIPVHLYGNITNIQGLKKISKEYELFVIDDAAQAHGSSIGGNKVGNLFDMSCFSFYPTKNLGALGEAGCITTNDLKFVEKINSIRNYGKSLDKSSENILQGSNHRGDEIQAAFLTEKLKNIENIIQKRKSIIKAYKRLENEHTKNNLKVIEYSEGSSPHLAIIKLKNAHIRNSLIKNLRINKIQTMVHYEIPCHKKHFIKPNQIIISDEVAHQAEEISNTILSLPMSEVHNEEEINYVIDCINQFFY